MREQRVEWAALAVSKGDVLDGFAGYCDETDELEVMVRAPTFLRIAWRKREQSVVELVEAVAVPARDEPTLAVTGLAGELLKSLLDDPGLRARLAVYDLNRLEKINAVRSSAFVHFEWFLRDEYGVKLLPAGAFTQGLVERGIISLGMG